MKFIATALVAIAVSVGIAVPAHAMDTNWPCHGCVTTHR